MKKTKQIFLLTILISISLQFSAQLTFDNYALQQVNIIDVNTSEYILTTDIHFTGYDDDHIRFQLMGVVEKLHQQLPTISAPVNAKFSKGLKVALGREDNLMEGMRFIFISSDEEDMDFADPLMWHDQWIQGRVNIVKENNCLIEIFPKEAIKTIKLNDLAIVR